MELQVSPSSGLDYRDILDKFIGSLDKSPSSKETYRKTLRVFFEWMKEKSLEGQPLSIEDLLKYKSDLISSGRSSLTITSYLISLRKFFTWIESRRLYPNIAKGLELPKRVRQLRKTPLSPEDVRKLLEDTCNPRDFAILNLMVRTGLRCIEVTRANVEDIQYKHGKRVLVIQGKGRLDKDRLVVLTDKSYLPIESYLKTRGRTLTGEALFTSSSNNNKGNRLTTRAVSKIAKDRLTEIGLTGRTFSAHGLRHTAGTNGLRAGLSLDKVASLLGHTSTETTKQYVTYALEEERMKNPPEEVIDSIY